jgi:hypothetical protein
MAYGTLVDLWQLQPFLATANSLLVHQLLADCDEKTSGAPHECTCSISADASAIASAAMMTGTSGLYQLGCRADGVGAGREDVR